MIACPEQDLLEAFRLGTCSDAETTDVRLHLDTCPHCRTRVAEIDGDDESLLADVRRVMGDERTTPPVALESTLGRYRVLRRLGAGGMGVVYEAEQENPRRRVALKVLRAGAQSDRALRRFEHEAQVLGRLQHRGIAQIFEAGTVETELGAQPYLAMELVEGRTLLVHAAAEALGLRDRLHLFVEICHAVEHAHQKGVIHRDLKPANILVVPGDGVAQPKVLDFGVAKLADPDRERSSLDTRVGQLIGTIPYMSPEQVAGRPDALDTRSDIYGLGVILYELLSGRLPHVFDDCTVAEAARRITERDPTPLGAVDYALRGDLESIAMKALEREPARRYQSAAQLAADVQRHLRDEPVAARPVTTLYQLQKFARRNTWLVLGVAVVAVALVTATTVSIAFGVRATRAAAEANAERERAQQVVAFLGRALAKTSPHETKGGQLLLLDRLVPIVTQIEAEFPDQPEVVADIRWTIGEAYLSNMRHEDAATHFEKAVDIRRRGLPDDLSELGRCLNGLAIARRFLGDVAGSERAYAEAIALYKEAGDPIAAALAQANLVTLLLNHDEIERAESLQREVLDVLQAHPEGADRIPGQLHQLGRVLALSGRPEEAIATFTEALEAGERVLEPDHPFFPSTQRRLAGVLRTQGRLDEAERWQRKAIALLESRRVDSADRLGSERDLIELLIEQGRTGEARDLLEARVARLTDALGVDHERTMEARMWLEGLEAGE